MFVNFFIIKHKEYLTEENSCFVIFTNWVTLQALQISKWAPCSLFEGSTDLSQALIKFFSCKQGRSFEGGVHLGQAAPSDNYGNQINLMKMVNQN